MAAIVLVHGIAAEQSSADSLEATWLPSLAGGVRSAGDGDLADRLWRTGQPGRIDTRMAFYGDLFRTAGRQGTDTTPITGPAGELAEALAIEWLRRAATRAASAADRAEAEHAIAVLAGDPATAQGTGLRRQRAVARLAAIAWFAPYGMAFAQRFVNRALRQVTAYFTDDALRETAIERVLALIGPETIAVVGHSLGSVVAYEATHRLPEPLPLLLTLGSPLGMRTIVHERLRPQPPSVPASLRGWTNIAARGDIVAAEPDLGECFGNDPRLTCTELVDNGTRPHDATHYLVKPETGRALIAAFTERHSRSGTS
ncbi:MAG TPA: hypothetical protein VHF06_10990 [Pseudonocardiaceae bacterium]|nr:hypothetical protein [Pseudonocardiaceae bacterium]